jgi:hypothetical protein
VGHEAPAAKEQFAVKAAQGDWLLEHERGAGLFPGTRDNSLFLSSWEHARLTVCSDPEVLVQDLEDLQLSNQPLW